MCDLMVLEGYMVLNFPVLLFLCPGFAMCDVMVLGGLPCVTSWCRRVCHV